MVHASPQVTAAQVLDAGRRAEADGRLEYAIQFYRHLTDHHSGAPEAEAAREALSRLKLQTSNLDGFPRTRAASPPPLRNPGHFHASDSARLGPKVGRGPIRIAPAGAVQPSAPIELPESETEYLTGRLVAHAFVGLGVFLAVAGLLATIAGLMLPGEMLAALPHWVLAMHPFAGPTGAATGIVLFLLGQIARAIFDIASASRDLAAIERAKVEHANASLR